MNRFILNANGCPVFEPDWIKWAAWCQKHDRRVAQETVGDCEISTVFLGTDHSFSGGPPILWETMVFGGALDQEQDRCSGSKEQAEAMHIRMVDRVRRSV